MTKRKTTRKVYWAVVIMGEELDTHMSAVAVYHSKEDAKYFRLGGRVVPVHITPLKRKKL